MVSPHGIQLAAHLISSYYGDLCSKVCECLLRRGTLTLPHIIRFTELTRENVVNCLRVLIHQNCVQAFAVQQDGAFGEAPKIVTHYMALFDNIIHKLRAPKFMQIVLEELGKECLEIFQGLLLHGRLSMNQIIAINEEQTAGNSDAHVLQENFKRLLNSRFIECCPAPEPFLEPPSEDETPKKKRNTKSAKIVEKELTIEQRALAAAGPMESMRFLMEIDDFSVKKVEESHKGVRSGVKRKRDVVKFDDDVLDANKKKEVVWRVNFEKFVGHFRHKACISCVKTKTGNEAGIVLSAILGLCICSVTRQKAEITAYLSLNAIFDEIIKKDRGLSMDLDRTRLALEQLECQTISNDKDESYSIDLKRIIGMAQTEEVESVVLRRYGREAYRIFRLLIKKGQLLETNPKGHLVETNKISDETFVDKKDTIKILYKLWKDNYVHMEKVSISAKPPNILLWKVNKKLLWDHVLDEMYHAALNLRLRITHELDQGKEILQLQKEKLVGEMEKKYKVLQRVKVILESSLMDLDDSIMLFHDF